MEPLKSNNIDKIKFKNIFYKIFSFLHDKKLLKIIKGNIKIQNLLNINLQNYKKYYNTFSSIELEIKPSSIYGKFINIKNKEDEKYYHIYFNDSKEEIKNKYDLNKNDKVAKIKIIIDYQIKSLSHIFWMCTGIESMAFKRFHRNNIEDMSDMFYECTSLKEIDFSNFNTENVIDMSYMFHGCSSLKELNLIN